MPSLIKNLLRFAISYSLTDREAFVEKVSGILEKYDIDASKSNQISEFLLHYLADLNQQIRLEDIIESALKDQKQNLDENQISELTKAIQELKEEIKTLKK